MKTVSVNVFDRNLTNGIIPDQNLEVTKERFIESFLKCGFRVFFCYEGRTTLIRDGLIASIEHHDSTPKELVSSCGILGVELTCLPYMYPNK